MRQIIFIIVSAVVLFASCVNDQDAVSYINPTYDGSTIKAELAINVPVGNSTKPTQRMAAEVVQDKSVAAENRFRGLQDIVLIPYKEDALSDSKATGNSKFAANPMSLSAFSVSNIDKWYIDTREESSQILGSSQVYSDVTIPIDTKHFMLYGRAMETAVGEPDKDFKNGALLAGDGSSSFQNYLLNQRTDLTNTTFKLKGVKALQNTTGIADAQAYLLEVMNNLLKVEVDAHTGVNNSWGAQSWSNMTDEGVTGETTNITEVFGLYKSFIMEGMTSIRPSTAGSSNSVKLRLEALYRSALSYTRKLKSDGTGYDVYKRLEGEQPGSVLEATLASTMSYAIMDAITASIGPEAKAGIQLFQFSSDGVNENFNWSPETAGKQWLTNFPGYFDLPDGTYQLKYNTVGVDKDKFTFTNFQIGETTPGEAQMLLDPSQICYPSELIYMANSGLRERQGVDDNWKWPTTLEAWNNNDGTSTDYWPNTGVGNTGWYADRPVNTATTAIAMKDQAQYAVASLKTRVKCGSASLQDNRGAYDGTAGDQSVAIPVEGIRITGVLVGNQPDEVDWELMPTKKTNGSTYVDGDFSRIVYDRDVPNDFYAPYTTNISSCVPNFTLLLDNYNASADVYGSAVKVNVALEMENNTGVGFYGVNGGFIPVGGKFYIIGKMDISAITDANRNGTDHVFQKDYMTEANFTITALKYAYNVIPDLRSAKLEFGLSVDIDWKSGAVFDIEAGGTPTIGIENLGGSPL